MHAHPTRHDPGPMLQAFGRRLMPATRPPRRPAVTIRASRDHDQAALAQFYGELGRTTLRRRFHGALNGLSPARIRALTDPSALGCRHACSRLAWQARDEREDAGNSAGNRQGGRVAAHGVWRVDADGCAEFALVVADARQGEGLGTRLMQALLDEASRRGLARLHAQVLRDNAAMLRLLERLGGSAETDPDDASVLRVELDVPPWGGLPGSRLAGWLLDRATGWRMPGLVRGHA